MPKGTKDEIKLLLTYLWIIDFTTHYVKILWDVEIKQENMLSLTESIFFCLYV